MYSVQGMRYDRKECPLHEGYTLQRCLTFAEDFTRCPTSEGVRIIGPGFAVRLKRKTQCPA